MKARWGVGLLLLVLVCAVGGWYLRARQRPVPPPPIAKLSNEYILFMSDEKGVTGIYTINPDGTGRRLLTKVEDNACDDQFTVSADGHWLGYLSANKRINVIETDGDGAHRLDFSMLTDVYDRPAVVPDGSAVIFSGDCALQEAGVDGNSLRRLTKPEKGYIDMAPQLNPDGTRIAYLHSQADTDAGGTVCVINRDGTHKREVSESGYTGSLHWSRDGRYLGTDWCEMGIDDGGVTVFDLKRGKSVDIEHALSPAFSPTEDLVAIHDTHAGGVAFIHPDGRDRHPLPGASRTDTEPVFSPDGQSLLLSHCETDNPNDATLVIIHRDGTGRRELTKGRNALWVKRVK